MLLTANKPSEECRIFFINQSTPYKQLQVVPCVRNILFTVKILVVLVKI
jgi:hypothetical protein